MPLTLDALQKQGLEGLRNSRSELSRGFPLARIGLLKNHVGSYVEGLFTDLPNQRRGQRTKRATSPRNRLTGYSGAS